MEILRWGFLAGFERRTAWLISTATAGFCVVVFLVALCAKSGVSSREDKGSSPRGSRWKKVVNAVKKRGFVRSVKDDDGEVSFLREVEEGEGRVSASAATPTPPLWQKKIIMGERCALPTFSGLILYDEKGNSLPHKNRQKTEFR